MPIQVGEVAEALEADNRRKPGQVERKLWECSNLGTQGNLRHNANVLSAIEVVATNTLR